MRHDPGGQDAPVEQEERPRLTGQHVGGPVAIARGAVPREVTELRAVNPGVSRLGGADLVVADAHPKVPGRHQGHDEQTLAVRVHRADRCIGGVEPTPCCCADLEDAAVLHPVAHHPAQRQRGVATVEHAGYVTDLDVVVHADDVEEVALVDVGRRLMVGDDAVAELVWRHHGRGDDARRGPARAMLVLNSFIV